MLRYKYTTPKEKIMSCVIMLMVLLYIAGLALPMTAAGDEPETEPAVGGGMAVTGQISGMGYAAKLYDADNGLPTSEANTVYSSSDGFVWIGGYSGLIRYDGSTFERQDSSGGITSVNVIFEDSRGRLWIGTNDSGIVCTYHGSTEQYSYSEGLTSSSINSIVEDDKGNIVFATKQGVFWFDNDMNIHSIDDSQIKNAYVWQLHKDESGAICGITKNGAILRIKDLRLTEYYNSDDLGIDEVSSILPVKERPGELWIGTNSGTICRGSFSDGFRSIRTTPIFYEAPAGDEDDPGRTEHLLASEPINAIRYAADRIWVLTNSRIFFTDGDGGFRQLENIPLDAGIETMTEDWEGNLWFTSRRQGVMKIAANKFLDLTDRAGLEPRVVNSTCLHNGKLYIGTDTGLQITNEELLPISNELTGFLGDSRIRCISEDNDGNLWISTFTNDLGLVCYTSDRQIVSYTEAEGMPSNKVRCTASAPDGSLLAATNGGLAVIKDGRIERTLDGEKGLSNTVILTVEATDDGKYYLGSDGDGIYVADGNNITHISRADGLTSDVILRIKKDEQRGVIWVVTSNSIQYIRDGNIYNISFFPYSNNYDIYFDRSGNAWILSSNGIYVAKAADMLEKESFDYVFYNVANGLPSVPTGNSFSCLDDNGDLYISGRSGVSRVNIDSYFAQEQDIRFSVLCIEDDKQRRYYPDEDSYFELPPDAKNITIYGYALTYIMHDPQIEYYLEGADTKPNIINKSDMSPVRYTNLSGGTYEYKLSLIDGSTHTVRQTAAFRIVKQRAFYEQWWFYTLCAAGIVVSVNLTVRRYLKRKTEIFLKREEEQKKQQRLFEQTATALVNAIDAKDKYTHGHSARVAEYSRKLAEMAEKSEKECSEIFYAALLHDVGKIGVPENIINKDGRLSESEFEKIKQHPAMGAQILQSISEYPYLSIGAHYHHERYDGKGYPSGLKGSDIPEIARIVSVADAYDAMTSKRSYRDPIPQQKVREEFVKGAGTQFDPDYARIMLHLIDLDTEYEMKEREEVKELSGKSELVIGNYRSAFSDGIPLTQYMTTIHVNISREYAASEHAPVVSMVLFDSLDGNIHTDEKNIKDLLFYEYGELWLDGRIVSSGARKMESRMIQGSRSSKAGAGEYWIAAVKCRDHVLIRIMGNEQTIEVTAALPDSSRFAYLALTGQHCRISEVRIDKSEESVPNDYIPRIAEEISYINVPSGDIPNVQIDGYRTDSSDGIPVRDGLELTFHTRSLPTARLVWHCPYIDLFTADDGRVNGINYRDLTFMRLDGECWECDEACTTTPMITMKDDFKNWDEWKIANKEGFDCTVRFEVKGDRIDIVTSNAGIDLRISTRIRGVDETIYAAITGDQCAVTNIRIK